MIILIFPEVSMDNYFCGWYYRCQSEHQTLALIPSIHKSEGTSFCSIQLITDNESFHVQFPSCNYTKNRTSIRIAENRFGTDGITLKLNTEGLHATGTLQFSTLTPIRYDIMGPFCYVPAMQCRHSILSMRHWVNGEIICNGIPYVFHNAIGYIEGDRGSSFPQKYAWTQCSYPDGALMLSVADIPFGIFHFTGVIGIILLQGKEYRIATYLGAKAIKITPEEIIVQQGRYTLIVKPQNFMGHPLHAPVFGAMKRTIHEHPSCSVYYRFEYSGTPLLELDAPNAAFEYEY